MTASDLERTWSQARRLARRHQASWEGPDPASAYPLRVFVGASAPRRVVVTTREATASRWLQAGGPMDVAAVAAGGRLGTAEVAAIDNLARDRSAPIAFLGDADPSCLHTFLCLQVHLGRRRVRYCGVSNALLDRLCAGAGAPDRLDTWELTAADRAYLRILGRWRSPAEAFGPRVASLLAGGRKLPVVGLARNGVRPIFDAVVWLAWGSGRAGRGMWG